MSYFMNPGGANQIPSFRSDKLPRNCKPEADNDKSSPVSGVCLCLLKTLRGCLHLILHVRMTSCHFSLAGGPLSLMIYWFSSLLLLCPLSWLFIFLLIAVVLPLIIAWREGGANSCSQQRHLQKAPKKRGWIEWVSSTFDWLLNCWFFITEELLSCFRFSPDMIFPNIQITLKRLKHELHKKHRTGTFHVSDSQPKIMEVDPQS